MPDEVKLLPCPWCEAEPTEAPPLDDGTGVCWHVENRCILSGLWFPSAMWNTRAIEATRPTLVTDEVVERVLTKAEAQIDENERAMIEERTGQYGALKPDQLIAIKGLHQQQRNGVKLVRAAMPTIVQDGGWV